MKKIIMLFCVLLLVVLNYFYPFTILKKIESFNYIKLSDESNDFKTTVRFIPKNYTTLIIPFLLKKVLYTSPYNYAFSIIGFFDELKDIQAYILVGNSKNMLDDYTYQYTKTYSEEKRVFHFKSNNEQLDIQWSENTSIKFVVEFIGVKNGIEKQYKRETEMKPEFQEGLGNQLLWDIESI